MSLNPIGPIIVGAVIGLLSGFFGVGGGFLLTPTLNILLNIPYNIAVGSGLCQMIGTSTSGLKRHHRLGNISYKLGLIMLGGNIAGVLVGTRLLNRLKSMAQIRIGSVTVNALDLILNLIFTFLLLGIGVMMGLEAVRRSRREEEPEVRVKAPPPKIYIADQVQVSIPMILMAGFLIGTMTGLLGIGGGVVIMPIFVYLLGVPTKMAVGTSLFLVLCSALVGTIGHALSGNVS
ncbi:TPA: sulfite exporter TauE/SafE family protein, partial [Candidatus Poribacteria bacterium]|nr:sulfite exporter TauE/SafE family protein [Candidatus Poribacteria bacterium]